MPTDKPTSVLHIQLRLPNTIYLNHALSTSTLWSMELGSVLRNLRMEKKLAQGEVADKVGVSQSTYCSWESGKTSPKAEYYPKLATVLGIDPVDLISNGLHVVLQPANGSVAEPEVLHAKTLYEDLTSYQKQLIVLQQQRIGQLEAEVQQLRAQLAGLL